MTDDDFFNLLDKFTRRAAVLCVLFALMCFTAVVAEHFGRVKGGP